jgi:hypothetical protein
MLKIENYRDTEVAALKTLAKFLEKEWAMDLEWKDSGFKALGGGFSILADIQPSRESDGLAVTLCTSEGRKLFDGKDYEFMHEAGEKLLVLAEYMRDHFGG